MLFPFDKYGAVARCGCAGCETRRIIRRREEAYEIAERRRRTGAPASRWWRRLLSHVFPIHKDHPTDRRSPAPEGSSTPAFQPLTTPIERKASP